MFNILALFEQPLTIAGFWRLGMLAPLALAISIVYKTIHAPRMRDVPVASIILCLTILSGMMAIGVGLLLVFRWLA